MPVTIKLDDELLLRAVEIHNVLIDADLTAKLLAKKSPVLKTLPEDRLCRCGRVAKDFAKVFLGRAVDFDAHGEEERASRDSLLTTPASLALGHPSLKTEGNVLVSNSPIPLLSKEGCLRRSRRRGG